MGPTLLDLQISCNTDESKIAYVLTVRAGGDAVSSLITAVIYNKLNVPISIAICTLISSEIIFSIPFIRNVYGLIVTFFILEINMGVFEYTINVFLIDLLGKGEVNGFSN